MLGLTKKAKRETTPANITMFILHMYMLYITMLFTYEIYVFIYCICTHTHTHTHNAMLMLAPHHFFVFKQFFEWYLRNIHDAMQF